MGALLFCLVFLYNKEKELIKLEITRHKDIAVYTVDYYNDFVENNSGLSYEELLGRAESQSFGCAFVFFYYLDHLRGEYNARYNQMQEGYYRKYVLRDFVNQVANELRKFLSGKVYETVIPRSIRLSEAPSHGIPGVAYDKTNKGSRAYMALGEEFLARNKEA